MIFSILNKKTLFFVVLLFTLIISKPLLANFSDSEKINVRIEQHVGDKNQITVNLLGDYKLNGSVQKVKKFSISLVGNQLKIDNNKKLYKEIVLNPSKEGAGFLTTLDGKYSYMGNMTFKVESKTVNGKSVYYIQPVNQISIANYLLGVVPNEMPSGWHIEALKSQTVAARTYTHLKKNSTSFNDTTTFQVYFGYKFNEKVSTAIEKTKNQVLTYNGRLAETFYSSSNGGYVNSSKDYGWSSLPYSVSKCDPYDPLSGFESTISKDVLINKVLKNNSIKKINSVTYSSLGENGRPEFVLFNTDKGEFKVSINSFRNRLDYNTLKNTLITESSFNGDYLVIKGFGWGHGVGMSQYGAKSMADSNLTYKEILGFYYPNTSLGTVKLNYSPNYQKTPCSSVNNIVVKNNLPKPNLTVSVPSPNTVKPSTNKTEYKYTVNTKSSPLSMRQKSTTSSKILTKIPKGKTVNYISGPSKGWYKISYGKYTGFVSADFIKKTAVKTNSSPSIPNNTSSNSNNNKTYKVSSGDTLYSISRKFGISVSDIKKINNLKTDYIRVGQVIKTKK